MNAIEYRHVQMAYGEKIIIPDFSLSVAQGEFVTVIGSSGCGKTTILKMVNGLVIPTGGEVWVAGKNIAGENMVELRRNIGYAIQGSVLFPHLTVEENIAFVPNLSGKRDKARTKQAVKKWMDVVGLEADMLSRYPEQLSGGQQQRVGIARALAASPEILLMDEPFGAVDEITRKQLQKEMKEIHQKSGITVLFVTHDIDEALSLGTKVLVMNAGKIEQFAAPEELLKNPTTEFVRNLAENQRTGCISAQYLV